MFYSGTRQSQKKSAAELEFRTVRPHHPLPGSTLQVTVVLFIPAMTKVGIRVLLGLEPSERYGRFCCHIETSNTFAGEETAIGTLNDRLIVALQCTNNTARNLNVDHLFRGGKIIKDAIDNENFDSCSIGGPLSKTFAFWFLSLVCGPVSQRYPYVLRR